jgi:hypothetical protein
MAKFAVLDAHNGVTNIIEADSLEIAESVTGFTCVPCENTNIFGATWNGTEFIKPELVIEEAPAE